MVALIDSVVCLSMSFSVQLSLATEKITVCNIKCWLNIFSEFYICRTNPCDHGECQDNFNGTYTCICDDDYTGSMCENTIDQCASDPCVNGTCTDSFRGYFCSCTAGFSGADCDTEIDECESNPCVNGTCTDGFLMFTCNCVDGFSGPHCDDPLSDAGLSGTYYVSQYC